MSLASMLALIADGGSNSAADVRAVIEELYGGGLVFLGADESGTVDFITPATRYYRKITLGETGTLRSLGAYIKPSVDNVPGMPSWAILTDVSSAPGLLVGAAGGIASDAILLNNTADTPRWIDFPCGKYLEAGDYWIEFLLPDASTILLGREVGGGTGVSGTSTASGIWLVEAGTSSSTFTAGNDEYLLRALFEPGVVA